MDEAACSGCEQTGRIVSVENNAPTGDVHLDTPPRRLLNRVELQAVDGRAEFEVGENTQFVHARGLSACDC